MNTNRYLELDSLRGIAALMVVVFHLTIRRPEAQFGFYLGTTGVDLFFIISGFVISLSLSKLTRSSDFIINRISRLYPTYWTSVTFTFSCIVLYQIYNNQLAEIDLTQYAANLSMFQVYFGITNVDATYWTMVVEMLFYIVMLFLFHFKLTKYVNVIFISTAIGTVFLCHFLWDVSNVKRIIHGIPLLQYLPLFHAGIIFFNLYTDKTKIIKKYLILLVCLTMQIMLFNYAGRSHNFVSHVEYSLMLLLYFTIFTLFVNNKLKFIVSKTTLFIGKISFALYLTHFTISTNFIMPFFIDHLHLNFWLVSCLITLPLVILIAYLITNYFERPFSKLMKEKLRRMQNNNSL